MLLNTLESKEFRISKCKNKYMNFKLGKKKKIKLRWVRQNYGA